MLWSHSWARFIPSVDFRLYLTILSGLIAMVGLIETLVVSRAISIFTVRSGTRLVRSTITLKLWVTVLWVFRGILFAIVYFKFCLVVEAGNDDDGSEEMRL